jgi:hypothetical protein
MSQLVEKEVVFSAKIYFFSAIVMRFSDLWVFFRKRSEIAER